jgi:hypothetical protein
VRIAVYVVGDAECVVRDEECGMRFVEMGLCFRAVTPPCPPSRGAMIFAEAKII